MNTMELFVIILNYSRDNGNIKILDVNDDVTIFVLMAELVFGVGYYGL